MILTVPGSGGQPVRVCPRPGCALPVTHVGGGYPSATVQAGIGQTRRELRRRRATPARHSS